MLCVVHGVVVLVSGILLFLLFLGLVVLFDGGDFPILGKLGMGISRESLGCAWSVFGFCGISCRFVGGSVRIIWEPCGFPSGF